MSTLPEHAFQVANRADWRSWLAEHHERDDGVWLVTFKKPSGKPYAPLGGTASRAAGDVGSNPWRQTQVGC